MTIFVPHVNAQQSVISAGKDFTHQVDRMGHSIHASQPFSLSHFLSLPNGLRKKKVPMVA